MWLCQYKILVTYQDLNSLPQDLNITIYDHHQCIPNHDFKNWEIQITGYITYGDSISQPSLLKEKCLLTIPSQHYSYQTRIHSKISSIYDPYFLMDRLTLSCFINTKQNSYSISKRDSNLQSLHLLAMALSMRYKYFL